MFRALKKSLPARGDSHKNSSRKQYSTSTREIGAPIQRWLETVLAEAKAGRR